MKPESKNSVSGTRKLVLLFGILFCTVVAVLLVVLYYPDDAVEREFDVFDKVTPEGSSKDWDFTNSVHEDASKTRMEDAARALEDFGAAFLALLAVCCVAVGLTCLFCACCILK